MNELETVPLQDWVYNYLSHELRTPLSEMLGSSRMLLDGVYGEVNHKQQDRLEYVVRKSQLLLRRLDALLGYRHLLQEDATFAFQESSVLALIHESLAATSYDNRGRDLQLVLPDQGGETRVIVDPNWAALALREVILFAATEASPDPTVWIQVKVESEKNSALVTLRYDAPALAEWRSGEASATGSRDWVGLPLADELLARMGGRIAYDGLSTRHEIAITLPLAAI
jgi:K+-sensing histidine kinase KdpD